MFGFIAPALLAEFALYLTHCPFLWLLPPCFYLLERCFNGTAKDRADLDVVLVVLAELHNAGVSAVIRVRERVA